MSSPPAALVVVPTYNERANLERVAAGVREAGHDLLVVDDNSQDGTGELALQMAAADPGISVLQRPGKLGLGSAYVAGFRWGLERGYALLCEMDGDGSHQPEFLNPLVEAAARSGGLAIGSRYVPGGALVGWGWQRQVLSRGANLYCRLLLGYPIRDCTSGYRCYTRLLLESIGLDQVFSQGYSFQIEMVWRTLQRGFKVVEVPIRFEDRIAGKSKVSHTEVLRALASVVRLRFAGLPIMQVSTLPPQGAKLAPDREE